MSNPVKCIDERKYAHHWDIESPSPNKRQTKGVCRYCGRIKQFEVSIFVDEDLENESFLQPSKLLNVEEDFSET